ncbi:MAG: ABC transporter ATP-binding protein [Candidatus Latescibacteria bacterium]|nr:ABC transporter ATP-binding protein [Candidatus Latescibacterota bacterium]
MAPVTLNQVCKSFDGVPVVQDISLAVEEGEFFSLLGPSGCGKTTILRMIAGFTDPTSGTIFFDDREMSLVPPNRRNIGMVFQNYALFPHMTVFENVAFGLRTRRTPKPEIVDRVGAALRLVGLAGLERRPVPQLSGGQQQRVALARAIVIEPALLLLDEPLSNLDAKLREETRAQILELQRTLSITTIYVTHDQEEALAVSDRVAVLSDGRCQQVDTPDAVYHRPANRFVARFMGMMNLWDGTVDRAEGRPVFRHPSGLAVALPETSTTPEGRVCFAIRPQAIRLSLEPREETRAGTVVGRQFKGASVEYVVEVNGLRMTAVEASHETAAAAQAGATVWVHIPGHQAILLRE